MNEREFLQKLAHRATEQEKLMQGVLFPQLFSFVAMWLGVRPWRIFIPLAFLLTLLLHTLFSHTYDELILKIFGGFGIFYFPVKP